MPAAKGSHGTAGVREESALRGKIREGAYGVGGRQVRSVTVCAYLVMSIKRGSVNRGVQET